MNKTLAALAMALAVHTAAFAQAGQGMHRTPEDRAQRQVIMMEPLKLTGDQQKAIYDFNMKLSADNQEKPVDREARMAKGKEIQAQRSEAYRKILTAAQYADYEKMRAERNERMMKKMQERNATEGND